MVEALQKAGVNMMDAEAEPAKRRRKARRKTKRVTLPAERDGAFDARLVALPVLDRISGDLALSGDGSATRVHLADSAEAVTLVALPGVQSAQGPGRGDPGARVTDMDSDDEALGISLAQVLGDIFASRALVLLAAKGAAWVCLRRRAGGRGKARTPRRRVIEDDSESEGDDAFIPSPSAGSRATWHLEVWLSTARLRAFASANGNLRSGACVALRRLVMACQPEAFRASDWALFDDDGIAAGQGSAAPDTAEVYRALEALCPGGGASANEASEVAQPEGLNPELRPYQRAALRWMLRREAGRGADRRAPGKGAASLTETQRGLGWAVLTVRGASGEERTLYFNSVSGDVLERAPPTSDSLVVGGILADEMGLGKTVEVIALLLHDASDRRASACKVDPESDDAEPVPAEVSEEDRMGPLFGGAVCLCGSDECSDAHGGFIKCGRCAEFMHRRCCGVDAADERGLALRRCIFCASHDAFREPLECRATLIVCPSAILGQWLSELERHVAHGALRVGVYEGIAAGVQRLAGPPAPSPATARSVLRTCDPRRLRDMDVVLTTFDVMSSELHHLSAADAMNSGRRAQKGRKRYRFLPSALTCLEWRRVILDEAQLAECTSSAASQLARRIPAERRWCVTGTPVGHKGLDDLHGLLLFLGHDPLGLPRWWSCAVQRRVKGGLKADALRVVALALQPLLWRSTKKAVADQLGVPPQVERPTLLRMGGVERHFYKQQHEACAKHARRVLGRLSRSSAKDGEGEGLQRAFSRLRQACCHPQLGAGGVGKGSRRLLSMEEIHMRLLDRARLDAEEESRKAIVHMNALGALSRCAAEAIAARSGADHASRDGAGSSALVGAGAAQTPQKRRAELSPAVSSATPKKKARSDSVKRKLFGADAEVEAEVEVEAGAEAEAEAEILVEDPARDDGAAQDPTLRERSFLLAESMRWYEKVLEREATQGAPALVLAPLRLSGCSHLISKDAEQSDGEALEVRWRLDAKGGTGAGGEEAASDGDASSSEDSADEPARPSSVHASVEFCGGVSEAAARKVVKVRMIALAGDRAAAPAGATCVLRARGASGFFEEVLTFDLPREWARGAAVEHSGFATRKSSEWRIDVSLRGGDAAVVGFALELYQANVDVDSLLALHAMRNLVSVSETHAALSRAPNQIPQERRDALARRCDTLERRFLNDRRLERDGAAARFDDLRRQESAQWRRVAKIEESARRNFHGAFASPAAQLRWWDLLFAAAQAEPVHVGGPLLAFLEAQLGRLAERTDTAVRMHPLQVYGVPLHSVAALATFFEGAMRGVLRTREALQAAVEDTRRDATAKEAAMNADCGRCRIDFHKHGPVCGLCRRLETVQSFEHLLSKPRRKARGTAEEVVQQLRESRATASAGSAAGGGRGDASKVRHGDDAGAHASIAQSAFDDPSPMVVLCELLGRFASDAARSCPGGALRRLLEDCGSAAAAQCGLSGRRFGTDNRGLLFRIMLSARALCSASQHLLSARDELAMATVPLQLRLGMSERELNELMELGRLYLRSEQEVAEKRSIEAIQLVDVDAELREATAKLQFLQNAAEAQRRKGAMQECAVCLSDMRGCEVAMYPCAHAIHARCHREMLRFMNISRRPKCPTCRLTCAPGDVQVTMNKGVAASADDASQTPEMVECRQRFGTKVAGLVKLLGELPSADKCIIFSQWDLMLQVAQDALLAAGVKHSRITGKRSADKALKNFRGDPDVRCLLLPLKHGGQGLTLVEATHVIMLEPLLDPSLDAQAIGRVHRIGQTKQTFVHRLVVRDTVEEPLFRMRERYSSGVSSYEVYEQQQPRRRRGALAAMGESVPLQVLEQVFRDCDAPAPRRASATL